MTTSATRDRAAAFVEVAAGWVAQGRRLDMQGLADEIGVSRVTLFRHVGGRDDLLDSALWLLTRQTQAAAAQRWEAERRPDELHTPGTGRHLNAMIAAAPGLRRLLDEEPALTLRILTDPHRSVQPGMVTFIEELLRRDVEELGLTLLIEPNALAYALVRLGESFLYADVLADRTPDVATANRVQQALLDGLLS